MTFSFAIVIVFGVLLMASVSDMTRRRIPNSYSIVIAACFVVACLASPERTDLLGGLWVAGAVLAVGFVLFAFGKFGGGDVKLMTAMALWAGPAAITDFLLVTALAGGGLALIYLVPSLSLAFMWCWVKAEQAIPAMQSVEVKTNVKADGIPYGVAIAVGGAVVLWSRYWPG